MMKKIRKQLQLITLIAVLIALCSCSNISRAPTPFTAVNARPSYPIPQPQHIALLLPLSDGLSNYANAIRNGFFTAYYYQKNKNGNAPVITIYNTSGKNIVDVYHTAVSQGANFIVGPLDKSDVATLASMNTASVPILSLNTTPSTMRVNNNALYEFGLSPTDEAQQAAIQIQADHHQRVIIIAPNSAWGQRLVTAFSAQWQRQGGVMVATQYYGNMMTLSKNIADVLQINNGNQSDRALKKLFHKNIRYIPERRQDFDSIFLVATPTMGQQIEPLLQYYFAGNIPTYATSQIYSANMRSNQDLNNILFCDTPWTLAPNQMPDSLRTMQQQIQATWPNNYAQLAKFYAMGVDAYNLTMQLNHMQSQPQSGIPGATGTLFLTPQHYIFRRLVWAKIQNGQPQLVN